MKEMCERMQNNVFIKIRQTLIIYIHVPILDRGDYVDQNRF